MLASSTLNHLSRAIPDEASSPAFSQPQQHLFEAIRGLVKVASYCNDIVNDKLQKCRFIVERLHRLHFPGDIYNNDLDMTAMIRKLAGEKQQNREAYKNDLEELRRYGNNACHESDFNIVTNSDIVSCALRVFTVEFVSFMGKLLNDKDLEFHLPSNVFEKLGPGSRFRRLAAQKCLAPAICKIKNLIASTPGKKTTLHVDTILHVVEKPALVYMLGRTEPVVRVVLSDGIESVYATLPSGRETHPTLHSYIDILQWRLDFDKKCIFEGARHVVVNVIEVLEYSTYIPKYGVEMMEVRTGKRQSGGGQRRHDNVCVVVSGCGSPES